MKRVFAFAILCLALLAVSCNSDLTGEQRRGVLSKSCADTEVIGNEAQEFIITVKTSAAWSASLSRDFATLRTTSGDKGENRITIAFNRNGTGAERSVVLTMVVGNNAAVEVCRIRQLATSGESLPTEDVNRFMDDYLSSHYLWNEEYRQTVKNYSQPAESYLYDVLSQVLRTGANRKDGNPETSGGTQSWRFYSYILDLGTSRAGSGETRAKSAVNGLGIYSRSFASMAGDNTQLALIAECVYPDSPAAEAGIRRGTLITKVNGEQITTANYLDIHATYFAGDYRGYATLTCMDASGDRYVTTTRDLTSGSYYPTPVIYRAVFTSATSSRRTGYLVYTSFDSDYDDELEAAFAEFRKRGITDIILDLRMNSGGAVKSSCLLSSILAGAECDGKVFEYYRYNNERMEKAGYDPDDFTTYPSLGFDGGKAREYGFAFDRIHVIATAQTASSSELVINSLRGIGKQVVVIAGANTRGKDVGMEAPTVTVGGRVYEFAPITFQSYNARGESDYDDGFAPDRLTDRFEQSYLPTEWGSVAVEDADTTGKRRVKSADYLAEALMEIYGTPLYFEDLGIDSGNTRSAAVVRALPAVEAAGFAPHDDIALPEPDWRRTNMYF